MNEERLSQPAVCPRKQVALTLSSSWYFMILCTGFDEEDGLSCRRCPSCCQVPGDRDRQG